jgi:hypothetical protein
MMHTIMHLHRQRMSEAQLDSVRSVGLYLGLINLPCIDTMKAWEEKIRRFLDMKPEVRTSVFGRKYYILDVGRILSMVRTSFKFSCLELSQLN